jgi:hypothetical protein
MARPTRARSTSCVSEPSGSRMRRMNHKAITNQL